MLAASTLTGLAQMEIRPSSSLCFVVDRDFLFRQGLASELRRTGLDVVELSGSSRLSEMTENQNPDIVLINCERTAPHDCVRCLLTLKECSYAGAVQLLGNCDLETLESFNTIGADLALKMLPPLQKPIKAATLHRIIADQKLGSQVSAGETITLAEALGRDWVTFLYQPKFDLKSRNLVIGAETVARVNHPKLGLLTPDRFLKGADQDDLLSLSSQALANGAQASGHFYELGLEMQISVNVGVSDLMSLPVSEIIDRYRPESGRWGGILLEIPSRQLVHKSAGLKALFPQLQKAGIPVALDNFGVGPLYFDMLHQMRCAEIKIDRSLVDGCSADINKRRTCQSIIQTAHNFGARAVAVGVANEADLAVLNESDCDLAQGYFFGKPMTVTEIDLLIAKSRLGKKDAAAR